MTHIGSPDLIFIQIYHRNAQKNRLYSSTAHFLWTFRDIHLHNFVSGKHFAAYRTSWMRKISMLLIPASMHRWNATLNDHSPDCSLSENFYNFRREVKSFPPFFYTPVYALQLIVFSFRFHYSSKNNLTPERRKSKIIVTIIVLIKEGFYEF